MSLDQIAALEGVAGQSVVSQDWPRFFSMLRSFAITCVPAALVNSGLKYFQTIISLAFRQRLTEHLHQRYLANRVYYVASTLGGLSNADQRITEDVEKFSFAVSELFSYTFKPVLDIVLFTRSLSKTIGYKGQFFLYGYFVFCSALLRAISPPLALMTSQEAALSGNFRNAHQRLVARAEEVAFNDPPGGDTERLILNDHLERLLRHARLSAFQKFWQQVADGYMVKYAASIIGLSVYAAPIYLMPKEKASQAELTGAYIRSMRLMMNTSTAIGQLVLLYKRITALAGFTSRVSELMESVKQLSTKEGQKRLSWMKAVDPVDPAKDKGEQESMIDGQLNNHSVSPASLKRELSPPRFLYGPIIKFEGVTISAPDEHLLVRDLTFEVAPGQSVMIMGPNGSGKSSLFRVLAELWPLQSGVITRPPRGEIFYLSQRPYVASGTLRDQVRYPTPPQRLMTMVNRRYHSSRRRSSTAASFSSGSLTEEEFDKADDRRVLQALEATEIAYLVDRGRGLDQVQSWEETLSGGERQRLAIARVLYHRPKYAVLDECTSAVSADGEAKLYERLQDAKITLFSIAHRPALKKYHSSILVFEGSQMGHGWRFEKMQAEQRQDGECQEKANGVSSKHEGS
ncbi:hypothetical protein CBR_g326 [Chara braunii]|uniref:ABC transporter domain-containing protein n=1 Tax=Chara braunii TaxID=69332 RepID=A0A388JQ99_CHABU|nr:hypothetical protein CBR_g326 [Chara braunii]|eukprot:GBG59996.1 hypothetical protein CBR_g326 [Chara braunii]